MDGWGEEVCEGVWGGQAQVKEGVLRKVCVRMGKWVCADVWTCRLPPSRSPRGRGDEHFRRGSDRQAQLLGC